MLTVTPIYLALAVVLFSVLSFYVITNRHNRRISIGDGNQPDFTRIIRGHGNFAEYAPLTLLAMAVAEFSGAPDAFVHASGGLLILGRTSHAYCFVFTKENMKLRVSGMVLTFSALWIAAAAALWFAAVP